MNILIITRFTDETFCITSRLELAQGLRKRGHKVTVLMGKNIGDNRLKTIDTIYLPTFNFPVLSALFFGLFLSVYFPFMIRKKNIDIIMIDGMKGLLPFAITFKFLGIPIVVDIRTLQVDKEGSLIFDLSLHLCRYIADGLTTITPELEEVLRKRYNLHDKKIGIWSSGVSTERFAKTASINEDIDSIIDPKSFILMYHGAYSPTRGVENLIKSMANLNDSLKDKIKLLLVGMQPKEEKSLLQLCKEIGVKDQVVFIPKVEYEKMPSYISLSNVGVIPLPPENKWWQVSSPLKTLEYLAIGKPIIATNIPFHQRIFDKGNCGVLLDTNSPKAIADAITYLYQNSNKLDEMGGRGKEIVENYYTWNNKAEEVEKFIKTVLAGH